MDLVHVYPVMIISLGTAFVIGMIYMVLLRCFAGLIIWLSIFGILGCFGAGGYWAYKTKDNYETSDNNYYYL